MQNRTFPHTFNSFDNKKSRVLITPHGPDPVFYGIRGEKVDSLLKATKILDTEEKIGRSYGSSNLTKERMIT